MSRRPISTSEKIILQIARKIIILILLLLVAITCVVAIFCYDNFPSLKYLEIVERLSKKWEVDVYLVLATIEVESSGNPNAKSSAGAIGLMQLMPDTAQWVSERIGIEGKDYYDVETNLTLGIAYIAYLDKKFDRKMAICAYNAGEGVVREWIGQGGKIKYVETEQYLEKIEARIKKLKNYIYLY